MLIGTWSVLMFSFWLEVYLTAFLDVTGPVYSRMSFTLSQKCTEWKEHYERSEDLHGHSMRDVVASCWVPTLVSVSKMASPSDKALALESVFLRIIWAACKWIRSCRNLHWKKLLQVIWSQVTHKPLGFYSEQLTNMLHFKIKIGGFQNFNRFPWIYTISIQQIPHPLLLPFYFKVIWFLYKESSWHLRTWTHLL